MFKLRLLFLMLIATFTLQSQELLLPPDFRQHNLTEYNSSLLSPVFALDRNNPQSIAIWSRWQWQSLDADPTSLFLNYTRRLDSESAAGLGFFQNNTGIFLQTGGTLNYAYALELKSNAQIAFGLNLFGYVRELADERFQPDPNIGLPIFEETNDFILRLAPSLRFKIDKFSIGIVAENLMDYNFTTKEKDTGPTEKVYIGLASYSFPVTIFGSSTESFIQPTVYMKTLPNYDNQFGLTTLFSTPKFWLQAGYNNFYGVSGGIGGRLFKKFSLGALMEFGTSSDLSGTDPSFEIVSSYKIGSVPKEKLKEIEEEEEEELPLITEEEAPTPEVDKKEVRKLEKEAKIAEKQQRRDSILAERTAQKLARAEQKTAERTQDSIAREQKRLNLEQAQTLAQQRKDSLAAIEKARELADAKRLAEERSRDSIAAVKEQERLAETARLAMQRKQDSLAEVERKEALAEARQQAEQKTKDSLAELRRLDRLAAIKKARDQEIKDSIAAVKEQEIKAEAARLALQRKQDSLAEVQRIEALAEAKRQAEQKMRDSLAEVRRLDRLAALSKAREQKRRDSIAAVERARQQQIQDSIATARAQAKAAEEARLALQRKQDSLAEVKRLEEVAQAQRLAQQRRRDSLAEVRRLDREAAIKQAEEQRIKDSIATARQAITTTEEVVSPEEGEKYEEAVTEDGLEPGFYLIANVFGTKKYFDSFMTTLKDQGLRPRSFFRSLNKYNYVYLQRYDSMTEARKARDSKFNGRYQGNTWIFRVVPQ